MYKSAARFGLATNRPAIGPILVHNRGYLVPVPDTSNTSKVFSVADPECLSRIPDLDFFTHIGSRIQGVKKAPDPGSGTPGFYLEYHLSLVESSLPGRALLAGDGVLPQHQVHRPVRVLHRPRDKPEQSITDVLLSK